ncbi:MAG: cobalt-precorrin-5B (C(1))-methyltransferase CbiD [Prochlorococcus sp.]|nr:cobalt-precorrin-5B (C(1))-methyltransferase CbiD [Prochlorococcaceae cyanobacterium ETNP14_MAG_4]
MDYVEADSKGLTLPVWVAAAARAATEALLGRPFTASQSLELPGVEKSLAVPVTSAAVLFGGQQAVAISHCDPGSGLDLTRGLEIWVCVQWQELVAGVEVDLHADTKAWLNFVAGSGVGTLGSGGELCASEFARELLHRNLYPLVPCGRGLRLEVVLPKGKELALRTSNAAFGVVDGLALIGTQAQVQISASPDQLQQTLEQLRRQCADSDFCGALTLVIGENGLDLARQLGLAAQPLLKVGNWLGPVIVAAAEAGVKQLLLLGYHGKLVKLAGGIFHTHHHLADGRLEVLTALAVREGLQLDLIRLLGQADSMESALKLLEDQDQELACRLWSRLASTVEQRSAYYLGRYGSWTISIGAALFDHQRRLRWAGSKGAQHLSLLGVKPEDSPTTFPSLP